MLPDLSLHLSCFVFAFALDPFSIQCRGCGVEFTLFVVFTSKSVLEELKKIIRDSKIMAYLPCFLPRQLHSYGCFLSCDDAKWPEPNASGTQELEIVLDNEHISFTVLSSLIITVFLIQMLMIF